MATLDDSSGHSSRQEPPSYLAGWRLGVVITCLFFGSFLIALDTNIINVAIPQISTDFHALDDVAWYGTGYLLTVTAFQPVYGSCYRFFKTDIVYRLSILIFEVGTVLCAAATSSSMFIVGRAVAGFGAAGVLQGALSIIGQVVQLEKRPLYMGIVISVFVITVCIGPPLGGVFTQHATWRWCFWINLPFGAVVLGGLTVFLKIQGQANEDRQLSIRAKWARMDPLGCAIFLGAVCCLLLALQWGGQTRPWISSTVIGLLVGAAVLALLFVYVQWKRKERALITLRILRRRSVYTSAMVLFFLGGSTYLDTYFLPFYFEAVHGISPVSSGVNFIPLMLSEMVALILIGAVVKQWGHYVPYILAGDLVCIVGTSLLTQLHPLTRTVQWAAYLVVTGLGLGLAMQLPYTAIQVTLTADDLPMGNAIAVLFYQLGGAIAIAMGQTVVLSTITENLHGQIPGLTSHDVFAAGAANLRILAPTAADLELLREIWNQGIARTMILSAALVAAAVPFTLGMEWLNAKRVARAREAQEKRGGGKTQEEEKSQGVVVVAVDPASVD
ncbi:MDR family MFS transporter [Aspergillus homomorphus CBS 101889]|uniref:MFS general substrate transporter n=1 Tax=Aspergillus homomorphus (strain CBS 101889) TaxID=1450537 RepID=A0A395HLD3_ASPHC|nr:MFS general substrate transporter [Aspergillus homomorphus CBS 101889]RAL08035.1 MFS general substrate transporter [Aspergillus homomorphus CBS 101889]